MSVPSKPSNSNNSSKDKEKGRYAQLLNENRQIVYISLQSKGKFYEIEPTTPHILQKSNSAADSDIHAPKQFNSDCVHRLSNIINADTELPITIRYISGPNGASSLIPENLTITKMVTKNMIIVCPIEETETRSPLYLRGLNVTPDMSFMKCFLGFENEQKMFSNPNVQNILKFCQINYDNFSRLIEVECLSGAAAKALTPATASAHHKTRSDVMKILKPINFPKLLRREKSILSHEKEDSIIFLSKNDLENMDHSKEQNATTDLLTHGNTKLKVFQSTKKKWFGNLKLTSGNSSKNESFSASEMDAQAKRMSLDRYQDMSKLLQDRFGSRDTDALDVTSATDETTETTAGRSSSEIGIDPLRDLDQADLRQKSMSLQDIDSSQRNGGGKYSHQPDLVRASYGTDSVVESHSANTNNNQYHPHSDDSKDTSLMSLANTNQQSFISEKLFSEFHVKTKQHSKSSSSLHHLLHFTVPQKMNVNEMNSSNSSSKKDADKRCSKLEYAMPDVGYPAVGQLSYDDDLPYSSVRDTLVMADDEDQNVFQSLGSNMHEMDVNGSLHENIYAEICTDSTAGGGRRNSEIEDNYQNSHLRSVGGGNSAIRISVRNGGSEHQPMAGPSRRLSPIRTTDNIYNTLN